MELIRRFFKIPQGSFVLLGPRGTGKSTLLRDRLPDATHLDIESPSLRHALVMRPNRLRELLADSAGGKTVVIDEIQHLSKLLQVVESIRTEPSPPRFVLTASTSRILPRGADRPAGPQLVRYTLHPLLASELRSFDLTRALRFGMLARAATASEPQRVVDSYANACIAEVTARGLTRHIGRFRRFLGAVSFSHGRPLNIAAVARRCSVERKIVAGYLTILEELMLAFRVPVFRKHTIAERSSGSGAKRVTVSRDKMFLFDAGFLRALASRQLPASQAEFDNQALAGLVAQHILAWSDYSGTGAKLCYWRTRSGTEVDLVVDGPAGTQAFTIKDAASVGGHDLTALRAFRTDHPDAQAAILYRGADATSIDGIWHVPVDEFLRRMRPDRGLLEWL